MRQGEFPGEKPCSQTYLENVRVEEAEKKMKRSPERVQTMKLSVELVAFTAATSNTTMFQLLRQSGRKLAAFLKIIVFVLSTSRPMFEAEICKSIMSIEAVIRSIYNRTVGVNYFSPCRARLFGLVKNAQQFLSFF
jgi:hypothetical protein